MKKTIKKLWVKTLRSGKYEQGKQVLKTANGQFCCLGVLCDLYAKKHKMEWGINIKGDGTLFYEGGVLPKQVMKWAGLKNSVPTVKTTKEIRNSLNIFSNNVDLTTMNDEGCSFKQIADRIDKSL